VCVHTCCVLTHPPIPSSPCDHMAKSEKKIVYMYGVCMYGVCVCVCVRLLKWPGTEPFIIKSMNKEIVPLENPF
jgi:hypothetical protein